MCACFITLLHVLVYPSGLVAATRCGQLLVSRLLLILEWIILKSCWLVHTLWYEVDVIVAFRSELLLIFLRMNTTAVHLWRKMYVDKCLCQCIQNSVHVFVHVGTSHHGSTWSVVQ